jgi:hypothetical protein
MMVISNEHEFGDIVYLKTDKEQSPRIVVCILTYKAGELLYKLSCGTGTSDHYDFEISKEANILITTTN